MSTGVLTAKSEPLAFSFYESLEDTELAARIQAAKEQLGDELLILGHHYQQDEVIQFADLTGDSFKLSRLAAEQEQCRWIVFCGVHFMAETADILANQKHRAAPEKHERVTVILPDLAAGCSMADMANIEQVQRCWHELGELIDVAELMPVTYVNSTAELKAFCGRHGGIVCTSSNARAVLEWSFAQRPRVLFFPDQHLGRNTAKRMGVPLDEMIVWDPLRPLGDNEPEQIKRAKVILWRGYCSVHQMFLPQHVEMFRRKFPDIKILVHPECMMEVVDQADQVGSTEYIIKAVDAAAPGTRWAIGTELHLVNRLKKRHPEQEIYFLSPMVCMCATMYRIDLPHLCWALENLVQGTPVNVVAVPDQIAHWAQVALERMLEVT